MPSSLPARDRLFAAARELYESEGLQALSLRAVGRHAGMSAMAIYRHFPDKDALIDALLHDGLSAWIAIVVAIEEQDPIAWLGKLVDAYGAFALEQPHRFDAAFLLPARHARTFSIDVPAGRSPAINAILARIEQAQAEGRWVPGPPLKLALMIAAMAQGLVSMHRAKRFGDE
ncbi:MAG TPA: TetR/AcrR family transcriptional regulator, partial [Xanthomonadaceae bacterium]|nr:TetR/AcrR family transcriptional regulator [Xanthomonadaceae bacterium]